MTCYLPCRPSAARPHPLVTAASLALLLGIMACGTGSPDPELSGGAAGVDDARLVEADVDQNNWLTNGRTY